MKGKIKYIIGAIVLLIIIVGVTGSDSENSTDTNTTNNNETTENTTRFTDRADIQKEDLEILPGETATIDGVKLTVDNVEYKKSVSEYETAGSDETYLLVTVTINNESSDTKAYNGFDFRVQTASGQVLDRTYVVGEDKELGSGDLVAGGKVSGVVPFEVPLETENQYIIWKPDAFDAARVIIQTKQ